MPVHGWSEKSQKWFKFYLRTERRASTIASGRTVKQSLSQENVLRSSVRRKYEQCNCIREHILEDYLYVSRINHFKHRLLPALLSNIAGCSAIFTTCRCVFAVLLSLAILLLRDTRLQTSETLIRWLACSTVVISCCEPTAIRKWFHDMSFATLVWIRANCAILWIALPTHNLSTLSLWGSSFDASTRPPHQTFLHHWDSLAALVGSVWGALLAVKLLQCWCSLSTSDAASFVPICLFQRVYIYSKR